jgi:hypothetical protein
MGDQPLALPREALDERRDLYSHARLGESVEGLVNAAGDRLAEKVPANWDARRSTTAWKRGSDAYRAPDPVCCLGFGRW